jgi:hypothetical protein
VLIPVGANLLGEVFGDREVAGNILATNPIVQAWTVTAGATTGGWFGRAGGWDGSFCYRWPRGEYDWLGTTGIMLANTLGYGLAALWLAWRAKRMFRRNVFDN